MPLPACGADRQFPNRGRGGSTVRLPSHQHDRNLPMPPYYESAPHRGGLLDLAPRSTAPTDLIGRLLDEADRVGLTDEQIRMLLRVQRDYRAALHVLDVELALAAHEERLTRRRWPVVRPLTEGLLRHPGPTSGVESQPTLVCWCGNLHTDAAKPGVVVQHAGRCVVET